ncbi:MAG TPA: hypothetical protein VFV46_04595 [Lacibacter sp.]|nr:hypothetical protein [Lacibacter sp.]
MKHLFLLLIAAGSLTVSCTRKATEMPVPAPKPAPELIVTNLNNYEIKYQQRGITLDVNSDTRADIFFGVQLIGDPVFKVDKRQFVVFSGPFTALPVNSIEQVIPLNANELIPLHPFNNSQWYEASEIVLMERNDFETGTIVWRGNWIDKGKKYLPFQHVHLNRRYNGWVELTAEQAEEKIVLHRMAISKEPEVEVKAGN